MSLSTWSFSETSPAAAGTATSVGAVTGGANISTTAGVLSNTLLERATAVSVRASLVGATGGTLDVVVQTSTDEGVSWHDAVHFTQLAAGAPAVRMFAALGRQGMAPVVYGVATTPALASGTAISGVWGQMWRVVMVAGTSTSAGSVVAVHITASVPDYRVG